MTREIKFRYELLNQNDLQIGTIDSVNGSVAFNSLADNIKRTARFEIKENIFKDVDYLNDRIRPIIIIDDVEYEMGVFLIPSPTRSKKDGGIYRDIEGYDVTQIILEDKITDRYFIRKNTNYISAITQIINSTNIHRVMIPNSSATLTRDREFEIGTSKLRIANELLREINYTSLWTDRHGIVRSEKYLLPNQKGIDFTYETGDKNELVIKDSISEEVDLFNVANVFVIVATNAEDQTLVSKHTNSNPASPTSTVCRKRNIVDYREVSDIANKSVLDDYVKRIAYQASDTYSKVEFETLINPKHEYGNGMYLRDEKMKIDSKFVETAWEIEMKVGGRMTHQARRVIVI